MKILFSLFTFLLITGTAYCQGDTLKDRRASFPGGEAAWKEFIETNLRQFEQDSTVRKGGRTRIVVTFVIQKNGSITHFTVKDQERVHPRIAKEALRILAKSPRWIPAVRKGKLIRTLMTQEMIFSFSQKGSK